jgi:signal transduction histidine kinase/ligand-binding sensor domain-containing protein/DNA-binding response OmpR family regulator
MIIRAGLLGVVLSIATVASGQFTTYRFENFSTINGLSSSTCLDLYQDRQGFLWFATIDGLNKYDGYEFTIYKPILSDHTTLSSSRINSITEDKEERLWIGTSNGLNIFDKGTGKFHRIFHQPGNVHSLTDNSISHVYYEEKANVLWVGTKYGINRIDLNKFIIDKLNLLSVDQFISNPASKTTIDNNIITKIIEDKDGRIWVATAGNFLNRYDGKRNFFERILIDVKNTYELDHLPKLLFEDRKGNFWIGNDLANMITWDRSTNTFKKNTIVDRTTPVFDIFQDSQGTIWIATDGQGLYLLDGDGKVTEHITADPSRPNSLPNNQPSKILQDRNDVIWIATYNKGINKCSLLNSTFGHYFHQEGNEKSLSMSIAQAVLQDSKNRIWIGTDGGGLNLLDEKTNTFTHYRSPKYLNTDKLVYLSESHTGKLYVCTWDGGLNILDPQTGRSKAFKHDPSDPYSIGSNTIWCALEDPQGRLWLGTQTSGVNFYDQRTGKFYQFMHNPTDPHTVLTNNVLVLFLDSKNRLLVGTTSGLSYIDLNTISGRFPEQLSFNTVKENAAFDGSKINHITEDHLGNIWIGADLGIFKLDASLKLLQALTHKDGLPNSLVTGIVEDNEGNIWMSTKSGLSKLDPKSNQLTNFNVHDGIQGMEFQSKSITKLKDGRILVGGINGVNLFNPKQILAELPHPKLMFTGLKIANEAIKVSDTLNGRVLLHAPISKTPAIALRYDENYLTFDFLALNYPNPQKSKYAYRMVNLDRDWNYVGNTRSASYSNLAPGNYKFEVMTSSISTWNPKNRISIDLKILPPPWKTWWAYLFYFAAFGLIAYYTLKYYTHRVREEKEHELDQMKLAFFINVSHEFRTPLTLILNPIDKILSSYTNAEEVKSSALTIQRSGRRLLNLVNQLLDLRKTDLGKSPLQMVHEDIIQFTKDLFILFQDYAKVKNIDFRFETSRPQFSTYFDPDKVEKILTNLLSNAIKFTDAGGRVTLSIGDEKRTDRHGLRRYLQNNDFIIIKVSDTGIGLTPEQRSHIFERFFHPDNSKSGTGIGLHFTKSLVELHHGEIEVESEHGKGTTFTVKLPIDDKRHKAISKNTHRDSLYTHAYDTTAIKSIEYELSISGSDEDDPTNDAQNNGASTRKPVVLIVEDNKELRTHLKNELRKDFRIKEAVDGADGLEKVLKFYPDIIISDIMMPRMDGFELCRKLKTDIETSHIPIVLLTARSLEEDKIEGYVTGADEYLAKPFNIHVLKARLKNLLESRQRLKEKFMSSGSVLPAKEVTTNTLDEVFLDKVTKAILANISDPDFSLENLLETVGISRSHFFRKINSLTGQNPSNFIRTVRLKYASGLLLQQQYSIKEVSFMAGFNSSAYFSKTFRELFGKTPQQYIEDYLVTKTP